MAIIANKSMPYLPDRKVVIMSHIKGKTAIIMIVARIQCEIVCKPEKYTINPAAKPKTTKLNTL